MKKIFTLFAAIAMVLSTVSCDKIFDNLEGDLTKMSDKDLLSSEPGIQRLLAALYSYIPMGAFTSGDQSTFFSAGRVGGKYSYGSAHTTWWNYTQMRSINKFLENLEEAKTAGTINEIQYKTYKGEALFIRAYCYFGGVKLTGGMPLVSEVLDKYYDGGENAGLYVPRSTEKETWDFIIKDLDDAIALLPETISSRDYAANKYVALALQSRVALWAASESKYWDSRSLKPYGYTAVDHELTLMKPEYANAYYQKCIEASAAIINSGKYSLYGFSGAPLDPASAKKALTDLFQTIQPGEYIFGKNYKNGVASSDNGTESWAPFQASPAGWTKGTRPITLNMVDQFADRAADGSTIKGKVKTRISGDEEYALEDPYNKTETVKAIEADLIRYNSIDEPFLNKDARFQAWVAYPNSVFRGKTMTMQAGMITPDGTIIVVPNAKESKEQAEGVAGPDGKLYYPFGSNSQAVSDYSAFYWIVNDSNQTNAYEYCFGTIKFVDQAQQATYTTSPWYDMRYAEVLLNYAEAVAESGLGDKTLASKCLNDVHMRAGFKGDLELTVDNVLDEVKCEFMAEDKWQSVLQRRRAYYSIDKTPEENKLEGTIGKKMTLLPMVDLSGDEVKYVFPRALPYYSNSSKAGTMNIQFEDKNYYGSVTNYVNNKIENNNTK
ncbi:MAG: RagB/SusD family nutrient uptake outer membrane protein [Bacteroidaceae bacterium]|nr:RagB/SusD family nutrient uptake outer membrane protein [Bacteroidaceae bacterium]